MAKSSAVIRKVPAGFSLSSVIAVSSCFYLLEPWPNRPKKSLAFGCRGDAACGTSEQPQPEALL